MSKGFIVGIGGGGASLNYKVVGGTEQPASPSENMIWVNTDAEITSHVFSATEPEAPAEGLVWFKTGSASNGAFNALKNDTLMVYILVVSQYTNGNWKSVVAKIWQSGKWGQFVTYVFKNGNIGLGGGIVTNAGDESYLEVSDVIALTVGQYMDRCWRTAKPIDVAGFKTMRIKGYAGWSNTEGSITTRIGLATEAQISNANTYTVYTGLSNNATTPVETSIDVSALEGEYYVVLWWHCYGTPGTSTITTYYVEFDV